MNRREYLTIGAVTMGVLSAGCLGGDNTGDIETDHDEITGDEDVLIEYNVGFFDRIEHPETGEVFESDEDTQWIGLQLRAINQTDRDVRVHISWFDIYADGTQSQAQRHESSRTEPFDDPIPAGETIETYFFYTTRPGRDIELRQTPFSQVDIGFRYDEDIEYAWE